MHMATAICCRRPPTDHKLHHLLSQSKGRTHGVALMKRPYRKQPIAEMKEVYQIVDSKKFTLDMDIVKNALESGSLENAQKAANDVIERIQGTKNPFIR